MHRPSQKTTISPKLSTPFVHNVPMVTATTAVPYLPLSHGHDGALCAHSHLTIQLRLPLPPPSPHIQPSLSYAHNFSSTICSHLTEVKKLTTTLIQLVNHTHTPLSLLAPILCAHLHSRYHRLAASRVDAMNACTPKLVLTTSESVLRDRDRWVRRCY